MAMKRGFLFLLCTVLLTLVGCACCQRSRVQDGHFYFLEVPIQGAPQQTLPPPRIELGSPQAVQPSGGSTPKSPTPQKVVRPDKIA